MQFLLRKKGDFFCFFLNIIFKIDYLNSDRF